MRDWLTGLETGRRYKGFKNDAPKNQVTKSVVKQIGVKSPIVDNTPQFNYEVNITKPRATNTPKPGSTVKSALKREKPIPIRDEQGNEYNSYTIKKGDSLSKIAMAHGMSAKDFKIIADLNPDIADVNRIEVGQTIVLPKKWNRTYKEIANKKAEEPLNDATNIQSKSYPFLTGDAVMINKENEAFPKEESKYLSMFAPNNPLSKWK